MILISESQAVMSDELIGGIITARFCNNYEKLLE